MQKNQSFATTLSLAGLALTVAEKAVENESSPNCILFATGVAAVGIALFVGHVISSMATRRKIVDEQQEFIRRCKTYPDYAYLKESYEEAIALGYGQSSCRFFTEDLNKEIYKDKLKRPEINPSY